MNRLLILLVTSLISIFASSAEKPNIIYILADDLGYGDLQCNHADCKVPTPHLNRLAEMGMRFTDAHSPSAVCTPTKYEPMTGRTTRRSRLKAGVLNGYSPPLIERDRPTVASYSWFAWPSGRPRRAKAMSPCPIGIGGRAA